jgi:uncharacterized protein YdeI (YjbR/CyaY-like superfamily)
MSTKSLPGGVAHKLPKDLRKMILSNKKIKEIWEDITPLARNEWICWIEDAKKEETRHGRIEKARSKMLSGMRRPCCWVGCSHR